LELRRSFMRIRKKPRGSVANVNCKMLLCKPEYIFIVSEHVCLPTYVE